MDTWHWRCATNLSWKFLPSISSQPPSPFACRMSCPTSPRGNGSPGYFSCQHPRWALGRKQSHSSLWQIRARRKYLSPYCFFDYFENILDISSSIVLRLKDSKHSHVLLEECSRVYHQEMCAEFSVREGKQICWGQETSSLHVPNSPRSSHAYIGNIHTVSWSSRKPCLVSPFVPVADWALRECVIYMTLLTS